MALNFVVHRDFFPLDHCHNDRRVLMRHSRQENKTRKFVVVVVAFVSLL